MPWNLIQFIVGGKPLLVQSRRPCNRQGAAGLFTQAQPGDNGLIALRVGARQVFQQAGAFADHFQQAAPRRKVLVMSLKVRGKLVYALCQQSNLDFS